MFRCSYVTWGSFCHRPHPCVTISEPLTLKLQVLFLFQILNLSFHVYVQVPECIMFSLCICLVPRDVSRECQIPGTRITYVLGTESKSSARLASAFNHRAISPGSSSVSCSQAHSKPQPPTAQYLAPQSSASWFFSTSASLV